MERILLFYTLQVAATGYACWRGGAPERLTGLALLLAALATTLLPPAAPVWYARLEVGILAVDLVLLGVMLVITLHADRYWPIWVTALHALGTGSHLARALNPDVVSLAYAVLTTAWSYPILLVLVVGTHRHSRRIRSNGWDLDWSRQDPTVR